MSCLLQTTPGKVNKNEMASIPVLLHYNADRHVAACQCSNL